MYFNAKIQFDPSQLTLIKNVRPEKMFSKLLHAISLGQLSKKQEQETFTAIAILQQLNMGLRSAKIKNIIRLAVDDYDFYLDDKGLEDDLEQAMFEFKAKVDAVESERFNSIYMALESKGESLEYLVEITVNRTHLVGEYPIQVNVNGVLREFKLEEGQSVESLKEKMSGIFESQQNYDDYISEKKSQFNQFIAELEYSIQNFIKIDDLRRVITKNIIRPKEQIKDITQVKHRRGSHPVFFGYYGFDSYFFYAWLWADMLYQNSLYVSNVTIVDENGAGIMAVAGEGFKSSETHTLNSSKEFEPPINGVITYYPGNQYNDILEKLNLTGPDADGSSGGNAKGNF